MSSLLLLLCLSSLTSSSDHLASKISRMKIKLNSYFGFDLLTCLGERELLTCCFCWLIFPARASATFVAAAAQAERY